LKFKKNKLLTFGNELWIGQTPTILHNCGRKNNIKIFMLCDIIKVALYKKR
jgi:hypothetical protein